MGGVIDFDIGEELRRQFDEAEKEEEQEQDDESTTDSEEEHNESSEAESEKLAEAASDSEEEGVSLEGDVPEGEGDEPDGREALDALRSEEEGEDSEEEGEEEEGEEEEVVPAPEHWPEADRKMFAKLPSEAQKFLFKQSRHFQADYMRKVNDVQGIKQALEPIREQLTKGGLSDAQAVRKLVGSYKTLVDNPYEGVKSIIVDYGVDVTELINNWDSIEKLETKQEIPTQPDPNADAQTATIQRRLVEWAKDKEFAQQVEPQMALIVSGYNGSGQPLPHIDEIYRQACHLNEDVRKELAKRERAEADVSKAEEAKQKAIKAKKGKISRKSKAPKETPKPGNLRDELAAGLERAEAGG